jgi:enoyl-CoA hydratase
MTMITREHLDGVVVVRMQHGPVQAMDLELLTAIAETFDDLAGDDAEAIVLTGTGKAFSAGVDLKRILEGGPEYVRRFLPALVEAFMAVFTTEKPVVAAVNGHAIAGGCILACACDRRFMAAGEGRIGVSELQVGVPFPTAALEILGFCVGRARAADLVLTGATHRPDQALARGLVEEVVPPEDLLEHAVAEARRLAAIPPVTLRLTKRQLRAPAFDAIARDSDEIDPEVADIWASAESAAAIGAFIERSVGRR